MWTKMRANQGVSEGLKEGRIEKEQIKKVVGSRGVAGPGKPPGQEARACLQGPAGVGGM